MGFRLVPGVPLGAWAPLPELMEDVRDLFMIESSAREAIPLFRFPGLGTSCDGVPLGRRGSKAECALPPLSLRRLLLFCSVVELLSSSSTSLLRLSFSTLRTLSLEQGSTGALGSPAQLRWSKLGELWWWWSGRAIFTVTGLRTAREFRGLRMFLFLKPKSHWTGGRTPTEEAPCCCKG